MKELALTLLNSAIQASYLVLALLAVRLIFKKAPKRLLCALWALVGLRLAVPVSLSSVFSLLPSRTPVAASGDPGGVYVQTGLPVVDNAANTILQTAAAPGAPTRALAEQTAVDWGSVLTLVWLCGAALLAIYAVVSFLRLRLQVREAVKEPDGVWLCDRVKTPFILGVLRPRIYLPSDVAAGDRPLILAHERAHLKRRDHLWKPLGFLLLTLYWFNPVLWVAYVLLCRDIELACDERVLKEQGSGIKKDYAEALLRCSAPKHLIRACPVAFGETGVKGRIRSVLNYKKPAFWVVVLALVASAAVAVCFMTTPRDLRSKLPDGMDNAIHTAILQNNENASWFGECATEGHSVLGSEQNGDTWKVYLYHGYERYGFINGYFTEVAGHWGACVLTMQKTHDGFICKKIDYPEDGNQNAPSIKRLFPKQLEERALNPSQSDRDEVTRQCKAQAQTYLNQIGRDAAVERYVRLTLKRPNLTAEVSNKLTNELGRMEGLYELTLGTREQIENGVRYVYRTAMLYDTNTLLFVKEVYGTDEVRELMLFSAETGELLYRDAGRAQPNELHRFNARATGSPGQRERLMMPTQGDLWTDGVVVNTKTFSGQSSQAAEGEYVTVYFNYPVAESRPEQMPYVHAICYLGDVYEVTAEGMDPANLRHETTVKPDDAPGGDGEALSFEATVTKAWSGGARVSVSRETPNWKKGAALELNFAGTPWEALHPEVGSTLRVKYPADAELAEVYPPILSSFLEITVLRTVDGSGPPEPTTRTSEPFVPPTTAKNVEPTTTVGTTTPPTTTKTTEPTATTKPTEPIWTTRARTPEEARAIQVLGEEAVERFPDLKNTTNSYLEKAYVLMNRYPKFKKANVKSYDIGQDSDGYRDVTLHTDKGDFKVKYDGFGCCVTNNQETRETMGIPYYFPSISEPKNVQQLSLYYAFNYMMRDHPKFQGAFVDSFDQTVENDKITVTLHTDQGDCTVVMGATGKYISTKA